MTPAVPNPADERFKPHATREMAEMFDDVSTRYDWLNRLMTLGRDAAWREAMWRDVPDDARVVLDVCTGSGSSLRGLRQPGRLVIGVDASLKMLHVAREQEGWVGWAPRLVAADAFLLPIAGSSVDCVTIAFGIRNLRPREQALRELARVLRPGGRLVVLEATAPSPGPLGPLHRLHLLHGLPLLGRLSPDPSAYVYLGRSILEFGPVQTFSRLLESEGWALERVERFMLGATHLWTCIRPADAPPAGADIVRSARSLSPGRGPGVTLAGQRLAEWRAWTMAQLATSAATLAMLGWAAAWFWRIAPSLPIEGWQRRGMDVVLVAGIVGFCIRSIVLLARLFGAPPRS